MRALDTYVLVDGAFDPLHPGHLAYFRAAAAMVPAHGRSPFSRLICRVAPDEDIRAKGRAPLMGWAERAEMVRALGLHVVDEGTLADTVRVLRPVLVKGADWEGRLPADVLVACVEVNTRVYYAYTPRDSSTARLRAWALADADQGLERLESYMGQQTALPASTFNTDYFAGTWRTTAPAYTLEGRRQAEGRHPQILADLWPGCSMLDVGCGPGFLVQFLHDLGVDVWGLEPSVAAIALAPPTISHRIAQGDTVHRRPHEDIVICREVLEHVTVQQAVALVADLFRLAKKAVYITTRFHPGPAGLFDVTTERQVDPTHQTLMTQPLLRALCVLNGGRRNRVAEQALDWQQKGRVLVYDV